MKKIKLPRKRKKKFKSKGNDYRTFKLILEILHEEKPIRENRRFYKLRNSTKIERIKTPQNLTNNGYFIVKKY